MSSPTAWTCGLLAEALELAGVACWIWQRSTRTLSVSDNFCRLLGDPGQHPTGELSDWLQRAHGDDRAHLASCLDSASEQSGKLTASVRFRHANGAWAWFELRARMAAESADTLILTFNETTEQRQTEAALRDSQLRYRALYTTSPLAFILWNREGYITEWNRRAEQMFGWRSDEVIGKRIHHLLLPEATRETFASNIRQIVQGQGEGKYIGPGIRKDGLLLHGNWYNVPLRTPQGSLIGVLSLVLDVTDEKNAQDQVQKSEKVYRTLVETSPDAILMTDLQGRLLTANQQAQLIFDLDVLEDLNAINLRNMVPETESAGELLSLLDSPDEYIGFIINRQLSLQSRQGRRFDASLAFTTVMDSKGHATSMVLFVRDITDKLAAERELDQHRQNLEALVAERTQDLEATRDALAQIIDGSPVPTFVLDAHHVVTHWNRACEEIIGVPAEDIVGTRDQWKAFYSNDRPVMADLVMTGEMDMVERLYGSKYRRSKVVQGGFEGEDYFPSCNRWLFFTAAPLCDASGRIVGAIETLQDISERKHAEFALVDAKQIAEAAANTKAEFLANMSHEIRTPMNAVIGLAHLLLKTDLSNKQHDYVSRIQGAGEILLRLINDVLDFSKIEAGRMELETTDFKLDDMLGNVATIVLNRAQEKGLELHYVVEPDVPMHLVGDPLRLTQVLVNLIGNAIKFTTHGGVTAFFRRQLSNDGRVHLEVDVQDTGIGMSIEQQGRLFQAFTQADTSITRQYGGTGLGLTISKRLVEMMDGRIWVTSKPNVGSTFSFLIVLGLGRQEAGTHADPATHVNRRVMVVDDNPLARTVLSRLLENQGCQIRATTSGREALAVLEESSANPYDYVTIDLNMPEMDGLELAAAIRTLLPSPPKLVLVTAADTHVLDERGELAHFDTVLHKPVTAAQIADLLHGRPRVNQNTREKLPTPLRGRRVLLAEDIPTNQLIATEMLQSFGITVETADNGRIALEMMQAHGDRFDAILMDMQMPEMDGLDATRRIRGLDGGQRIPIIAMTAHALDSERDRCLQAGMNDFITKPVDPELLHKVLTKAIGVKAIPAEAPVTQGPADELPNLPGIDKAEGLKRMMNKVALYRRVLADFHTRFANEATVIRSALHASDRSTAERHAHSTKGLAGSIGATRLQLSAKALEEAIKHHEDFPSDAMADYEAALEEVINSIRAGILDA